MKENLLWKNIFISESLGYFLNYHLKNSKIFEYFLNSKIQNYTNLKLGHFIFAHKKFDKIYFYSNSANASNL